MSLLTVFKTSVTFWRAKKKNKNVFQSELEVLLCFEMNHKFLERHKKPLSLAATRTRKSCEHGPENGKHWKVQPNKTKKRQRKKCQGRLSYIQKKK